MVEERGRDPALVERQDAPPGWAPHALHRVQGRGDLHDRRRRVVAEQRGGPPGLDGRRHRHQGEVVAQVRAGRRRGGRGTGRRRGGARAPRPGRRRPPRAARGRAAGGAAAPRSSPPRRASTGRRRAHRGRRTRRSGRPARRGGVRAAERPRGRRSGGAGSPPPVPAARRRVPVGRASSCPLRAARAATAVPRSATARVDLGEPGRDRQVRRLGEQPRDRVVSHRRPSCGSGWRDSNPRPLGPKPSALPTCATARGPASLVGGVPAADGALPSCRGSRPRAQGTPGLRGTFPPPSDDGRPQAGTQPRSPTTVSNRKAETAERQARLAAIQAAQRKGERRRTTIIAAVVGVVVLALIGVTLFVVIDQNRRNADLERSVQNDIPGVETFTDLTANHVESDVEYAQNPPVGGDHNAVWQNCGVYSQPVARRSTPSTRSSTAPSGSPTTRRSPADQVELLDAQAASNNYVLVTPRDDLPTPVVASAWGLQLQLEDASDERLATFVRKYVARRADARARRVRARAGPGRPSDPTPRRRRRAAGRDGARARRAHRSDPRAAARRSRCRRTRPSTRGSRGTCRRTTGRRSSCPGWCGTGPTTRRSAPSRSTSCSPRTTRPVRWPAGCETWGLDQSSAQEPMAWAAAHGHGHEAGGRRTRCRLRRDAGLGRP